jgi:hypothetical protein
MTEAMIRSAGKPPQSGNTLLSCQQLQHLRADALPVVPETGSVKAPALGLPLVQTTAVRKPVSCGARFGHGLSPLFWGYLPQAVRSLADVFVK